MNVFVAKFMQENEERPSICSEAETAAKDIEASEYVTKYTCMIFSSVVRLKMHIQMYMYMNTCLHVHCISPIYM